MAVGLPMGAMRPVLVAILLGAMIDVLWGLRLALKGSGAGMATGTSRGFCCIWMVDDGADTGQERQEGVCGISLSQTE